MGGRALETSRVDKKRIAVPVADGLVSVAVNDTVGFRKQRPHSFFDVVTGACAMAESDGIAVELDFSAGRECSLQGADAHITVDGIENSSAKYIQNSRVGNVAGVEDDIALAESFIEKVLHLFGNLMKVGVREDSCT